MNTHEVALTVLIVDDHAIVREGLKRMLSDIPDWRVTEAASALDALLAMRREASKVVVMDVSMPGMGGLDLLRRLRGEFPRVRILMLSMHAEEQYAMRALKSGANGYITKDVAAAELVTAIRKVAAGGAYVSPSLSERMILNLSGVRRPAAHPQLSNRELDVLNRLVAGHRPTEIARALSLSVKTVSTHKRRILDRLQLPNLAALIRYALEQGIASDEASSGRSSTL